jgi:hypothetical protein
MTIYYIDACVWRDYFEDRRDNLRPLGEFAFKLIQNIIKNEDQIVISDHLLDELRKHYSDEQIDSLFKIVPDELIIRFHNGPNHTREAFYQCTKLNLNKPDAIHLIIASENDALFITRDHHFDHLKERFEIYRPEELI